MANRTIPKKILTNIADGKSGLYFTSDNIDFHAYAEAGAPYLTIHKSALPVGHPMRFRSLHDLARAMRRFAPLSAWHTTSRS